jgi:hypothetical protein
VTERSTQVEHPVEDEESPSPIGWGRAALTAIAILVIGTATLVIAPNWVLVHLTGLSRNGRVAVATVGFVVIFVALAWELRRLQARGVI